MGEYLAHPMFSSHHAVYLPRGPVRCLDLAGNIGAIGAGLSALLGLVLGHGMYLWVLQALLLTQVVAAFAPIYLQGCRAIIWLARQLNGFAGFSLHHHHHFHDPRYSWLR